MQFLPALFRLKECLVTKGVIDFCTQSHRIGYGVVSGPSGGMFTHVEQ